MFSFEGYTLDLLRGSLRMGDRDIGLRPKSFEVLRYLVENASRLVTRDELIKAVWSNVIVTDDSLTQCISDVRHALGDSGQAIKTVARRGYRFAAPVSRSGTDDVSIMQPARKETVLITRQGVGLLAETTRCDQPSIAVLPFDDLSGDTQQGYFGDGLVEEIITALSCTTWLLVSPRNSSFTYKGRAVDVKQAARELGVQYLLEGSVRRGTNRVRVSYHLIDAANGMHVWAERVDSALGDILDMQDRIATNVVNAIQWRLERAAVRRARSKPLEALSSYDYFLRGMANRFRLNAAGSNEALANFNKAIALDQEFAAAYGMAAWCHIWRRTFGWAVDAVQEDAEAVRLARCALEVGWDDPVALGCAGYVLGFIGGELDAGTNLIDRALTLNPHWAPNWHFNGWLKLLLGEPQSAIECFAQIMRLSPSDPLLVHTKNGNAWAHFVSDRYDEALSWAERALQENPHHKPALRVAAATKARLGTRQEARAVVKRLGQIDPAFRIGDVGIVAPFRRSEDLEKFQNSLREAGLPD